MRKHFFWFLTVSISFWGCQYPIQNNEHNSEEEPLEPRFQVGLSLISIQDTTKPFATWNDKEFYKIYNDVFAPRGFFEDSLKLKLTNITTQKIDIPNTRISDVFSVQDSIEMFNNIDTNNYTLDCSRLNNTICISIKEYFKIFFPVGMTKENGGEMIDKCWENFKKKYGLYGLHYISIPLLNKDKNRGIIIKGGAGSASLGSEELYFIELKKGKWKTVKEITLQIS